MYMNISEFRKDISNQFNAALTQDVHIERGGITFVLRAVNYKIVDGHVNVPQQRNRDMDKVYADKGLVAELIEVPVNDTRDLTASGELFFHAKSQNTCKNGHPIPAGRDRCLGKGCKYA